MTTPDIVAQASTVLKRTAGLPPPHQGTVSVRSAAGDGTTFTVTMPRHVPPDGVW
jgi:hypothetical protein